MSISSRRSRESTSISRRPTMLRLRPRCGQRRKTTKKPSRCCAKSETRSRASLLADSVSADTSVVLRLTKPSPVQMAYATVIGATRLALSFQVRPELLSTVLSPLRQSRLDDLLGAALSLPHSPAADVAYALTSQKRRELRRNQSSGSDASDADVWIIATALEHSLPLLSHDSQQVALGRAVGLSVWTNLPTLRTANPVIR